MKKAAMLGIILVLLAAVAVPVYAKGNPNGHGNGAGAGQGNSTGVNPGDRFTSSQGNHGNGTGHGSGVVGNHGHMRMRTPFYLQGTISAIDATVKTVTVTVVHGNAQVKQYLGGNLTLQTNLTTLYFKVTQGNDDESETEGAAPATLSSSEDDGSRTAIAFEGLAVGQKVAIHGNVVTGGYIARLITVYLQTAAGEPTG